MKHSTVYLFLAVVLCSSAIVTAQMFVYASNCARCNAIGASVCYNPFEVCDQPRRPPICSATIRHVTCLQQSRIRNCLDCTQNGGKCSKTSIGADCVL